MHWMVCTVFYLASRLNGWKHKCTFCWMKDHWTWLISDIDAWDFFWYGTHYLFLGVTYIFKLLCKTSFLTLWVCEWVFKVPCWWYIVAIWREPWKNSKCHLYNIFQLSSLTGQSFLNSALRNLFTVGSSTQKTTITDDH